MPTPRDLFLSRDLTEAEAHGYLAARGFRDPATADELLQQLADDLPTRLALGELADLLIETLTEAADPDAAVAGFCRYVANRFPKSSFIGYLQDDPRTLQILTALQGASPLLGDILIRNPEHLHWLHRELDCPPPDLDDYQAELNQLLAQDTDAGHRLDMLKRFQRRETLRIAGRDLLEKDTLRSTTEQLSNLADVLADGVLRAVRTAANEAGGAAHGSFAVIGMGRLGGRELSYSPDIQLACLYDPDDPADAAAGLHFRQLAQRLTAGLSETAGAGYLYRVEPGLQPPDSQAGGALALEQGVRYCERAAGTDERLALINMRPIAGDPALGRRFLERVAPIVYGARPDPTTLDAPAGGTAGGEPPGAAAEEAARNVRSGPGGSREVELFTRRLQLLHGARHPDLQDANTLAALAQLAASGLLAATVAEPLAEAYSFLRRLEHRLQIGGDGQTAVLPADPAEMAIAARRMGFAAAADLEAALARHRSVVQQCCSSLPGRTPGDTV